MPNDPHTPDNELEYEDYAFERARAKLAAIRSGESRGRPAGRFPHPLIGTAVVCLFGAGFLAAAIACFGKRGAEAAGYLFLFCALPWFVGAIFLFLNSRADTPKRALKLFFRAAASGKEDPIRSLVVPADLDSFPRYPPDEPGLGDPAGASFRFADRGDLEQYWSTLLRDHTWPYCLVRVKDLRIKRLDDDILRVRFEVRFIRNTRLWYLLILVALLIAAIIDIATRKTAEIRMTKLLVRVGNEWHLFNGGLLEPDEEDLGWMDHRAP